MKYLPVFLLFLFISYLAGVQTGRFSKTKPWPKWYEEMEMRAIHGERPKPYPGKYACAIAPAAGEYCFGVFGDRLDGPWFGKRADLAPSAVDKPAQ